MARSWLAEESVRGAQLHCEQTSLISHHGIVPRSLVENDQFGRRRTKSSRALLREEEGLRPRLPLMLERTQMLPPI